MQRIGVAMLVPLVGCVFGCGSVDLLQGRMSNRSAPSIEIDASADELDQDDGAVVLVQAERVAVGQVETNVNIRVDYQKMIHEGDGYIVPFQVVFRNMTKRDILLCTQGVHPLVDILRVKVDLSDGSQREKYPSRGQNSLVLEHFVKLPAGGDNMPWGQYTVKDVVKLPWPTRPKKVEIALRVTVSCMPTDESERYRSQIQENAEILWPQ